MRSPNSPTSDLYSLLPRRPVGDLVGDLLCDCHDLGPARGFGALKNFPTLDKQAILQLIPLWEEDGHRLSEAAFARALSFVKAVVSSRNL